MVEVSRRSKRCWASLQPQTGDTFEHGFGVTSDPQTRRATLQCDGLLNDEGLVRFDRATKLVTGNLSGLRAE